MNIVQPLVFGLILLVALAVFVGIPAWRERRVNRAGITQSQNWLAKQPSRPKLTDDEVRELKDWFHAQTRDCIRLDVVSGAAAATPGGCRIGGPAWMADQREWPSDSDGKPMEFLAQIDFSELPPLPDFPQRGVLQFFIGRNDYFGCDFDQPTGGDFRVIWHETIGDGGSLVPQRPAGDDHISPLCQPAREQGRSLKPSMAKQRPGWATDWAWRDKMDLYERIDREFDDIWETEEADGLGVQHHVGGYPDFTQYDFRNANICPDHDVVLLQLWSTPMDDICWGDVGQANFMISRADLQSRDFSRVSYQWDCT